jgi:hypothetical protein
VAGTRNFDAAGGTRLALRHARTAHYEGITMLYTVAIVLLVLWLLGLVTHVLGGFIHILLVIAIVAFVYQLIKGKRGAT